VSAEEINRQLRRVIGFTLHDLEENRAGRLSDSQLKDARWRLIIQALGFGGAIILIMMTSLNRGSGLQHLGLSAVALLLVAGYIIGRQWQVDVRQRRVVGIQGPVQKEAQTSEKGMGTQYILIIQNERVGASASVFHAFVEGEVYQVFFTARGHQVVSAEYVTE
jgi:hypothetical protein